jgi:hypothetical protein
MAKQAGAIVRIGAALVEIQPLAYMLEDLLHEASDDGLEVCLAESPHCDLPGVQEEYGLRYQTAIETVVETRGQSTFTGGPREPGRPRWHMAEHMTCWSDPTGVIYVALVREPECVRIVAGARPHPVEREAITLLPPSG